jgi:hypothetical protein
MIGGFFDRTAPLSGNNFYVLFFKWITVSDLFLGAVVKFSKSELLEPPPPNRKAIKQMALMILI